MYIRLDVFASLLRVRPGELLHAARTGGMFDGVQLPPSRQIRGATLMFDQAEAISFAERWHARLPDSAAVPSDEPLMPLDAFAKKAGIAPLALWQAVSRRKRLGGITLPVPVRSEGQLLFEPAAVHRFVSALRQAEDNAE